MIGQEAEGARIAKLADDIKIIEHFAENHGFDSKLLVASAIPASSAPVRKGAGGEEKDWPLWIMIAAVVGVLVSISVLQLGEDLEGPTRQLLLVAGLLCVVVATMCTHLRFKDTIVTTVAAVGIVVVLLVGAEVVTLKEALDAVKDMKE